MLHSQLVQSTPSEKSEKKKPIIKLHDGKRCSLKIENCLQIEVRNVKLIGYCVNYIEFYVGTYNDSRMNILTCSNRDL